MSAGDHVTAIGVISGTSMDGIDVSVIETDGLEVVRPGPGRTYPYDPDLREELLRVAADATEAEHAPLVELEKAVTSAHAGAVEQFRRDFPNQTRAVSLAGLHGQTIYHRPERRFTRQLGIGGEIARRLKMTVVTRFRHADVEAGGEGAPLAPLYHRALAAGMAGPVMILNLGGVGNVTYIDGETVIAFDTGPASALIDDFIRRRTGAKFDNGGKLASSGQASQSLLNQFLGNPFFARKPPKSLDRNDFATSAKGVEKLSDADGAATLAAFTISATVAAQHHVPANPRRWLVTGGGRHNAYFMRRLAEELAVPVEPVEVAGWDGDYLEAQCFGYLAVRALNGLPLSLPTTTGVPNPMTGGVISRP